MSVMDLAGRGIIYQRYRTLLDTNRGLAARTDGAWLPLPGPYRPGDFLEEML